MLWNNNQKRTTNTFLWGIFAGVIGGMYLSRWMNSNTSHKDNRSQQHNDTKQKPSTEHKGQSDNDKLFETFMNASENELMEKAAEMKLKN